MPNGQWRANTGTGALFGNMTNGGLQAIQYRDSAGNHSMYITRAMSVCSMSVGGHAKNDYGATYDAPILT